MPVWFWFHIAMEDGAGIDAALVLRMLRVLLCRIMTALSQNGGGWNIHPSTIQARLGTSICWGIASIVDNPCAIP